MSSNSIIIADREIVDGRIEGVDFGPKLWVIARSPTAILVWVFGHSWSNNGHSYYAEPHLTILPDRTPRFMYHPKYISLPVAGRLNANNYLTNFREKIENAFGGGSLTFIRDAVRKKRTAIFEGGAGSLLPFKCYGAAHREWRAAGGGFIVRPEGVSEHDTMRHKLGWKPKEKTA